MTTDIMILWSIPGKMLNAEGKVLNRPRRSRSHCYKIGAKWNRRLAEEDRLRLSSERKD